MRFLKMLAPGLLGLFLAAACSHEKAKPLAPSEITKVNDFMALFEPVELPFSFADSSLAKKKTDSVQIPYKVFTLFVPDSFVHKTFGKNVKPVFYPMGSVPVKGEGSYLFVKAVQGNKKAILLIAFNKKQEYIAGITALKPDQDQYTAQSGVFDRKFTLNKTTVKRTREANAQEGREVYVLNEAAGNFMLIMTEALDDKPAELINPIDTLPRKNKWSADYISGKRTIISVRDGKRAGILQFFMHIEKSNGECIGQLKGEMDMKTGNTGIYHEDGDPCSLKFIFNSGSVTLQEQGGCGSHRGLQCTLDGNYTKKKYVKPASANVRRK
ncbi:MAG: hypothetical protein IPP93_07150 [Chitinophagaceae bacterium]|nr:hypothetical protein [Chitinophagaceae bacterium]